MSKTILPFNGLTPAEDERLAVLFEECSEVIQAVAKILRHGYESFHPDYPETSNRELLAEEIGHVQAAIGMLLDTCDIYPRSVAEARVRKVASIQRYLHHQEFDADGGILPPGRPRQPKPPTPPAPDDYTARMAEAQATREELGRDHTEDPRAMVEPAPAPARWRCEGCGADLDHGLVSQTATDHHPAMAHPVGDAWCGPVVPVEAGS